MTLVTGASKDKAAGVSREEVEEAAPDSLARFSDGRPARIFQPLRQQAHSKQPEPSLATYACVAAATSRYIVASDRYTAMAGSFWV